MEIAVKYVLDPPETADGFRILIAESLPPGPDAKAMKINLWLKNLAPSPDLACWFNHEPAKWEDFKRRYTDELDRHAGVFEFIIDKLLHGGVTLLYDQGDHDHNYALALKEYIDTHYLIVEET